MRTRVSATGTPRGGAFPRALLSAIVAAGLLTTSCVHLLVEDDDSPVQKVSKVTARVLIAAPTLLVSEMILEDKRQQKEWRELVEAHRRHMAELHRALVAARMRILAAETPLQIERAVTLHNELVREEGAHVAERRRAALSALETMVRTPNVTEARQLLTARTPTLEYVLPSPDEVVAQRCTSEIHGDQVLATCR